MGQKRISKRSKVKPFIKVINYSHLLPTRYALELESLKGSVTSETFKEPTQREEAKKVIKKHFEERYARGANRWCEYRELAVGGVSWIDALAIKSARCYSRGILSVLIENDSLHQAPILNHHLVYIAILLLLSQGRSRTVGGMIWSGDWGWF